MNYTIIEARTKISTTEEQAFSVRREIGTRVFSRVKRFLDHNLICFMYLGGERGVIRITARPFDDTLRQQIEVELNNEFPILDVVFAENPGQLQEPQ